MEWGLLVLASAALVCGAVSDVRSRIVPVFAGMGILVIGLGFLLLKGWWLGAIFYLAAVWGSRGGFWRPLVLVAAVILIGESGVRAIPLALGIMFTLSIFWLGWLGGGDSQLAFGLMALSGDWWMLGYLFGGTILVGLGLMVARRGVVDAGRRAWQILQHLASADEEAISVPWAALAGVAGLVYIWIWPGAF